ncbi:MAG: OFA family MFS transporter [Gammaproteobacteria bacterium]|nr:OFA family MFS transporter [Gammaproteobacteria bacterium]
MSSIVQDRRAGLAFDFLSKERSIAGPGFNRWLVPPAALAIHLCIGMAYGFSVFWLPLSKAVGITDPRTCAAGTTVLAELFVTDCDWKVSTLGWMYTLFFVFLGSSAALFGGWLERAGPRKAGLVSMLCWCGGMLIAAYGIHVHQFWLMLLGSGVIGGIGLGLGYISPVSTLIKWFPDRRGMATGMAIMGFGGGAMIGSPLAQRLMTAFASPTSIGVAETFVVLALVYALFMTAGALAYRVPASGWTPPGWGPAAASGHAMISAGHVHLDNAHKTPQFWLVWAVLCLNVTAGIGVIGMASPMLQEVFGGRLIGLDVGIAAVDAAQAAQIAAIAAGFTGLLSLFNIGGRFFWASMSDRLGRKATYAIFFLLGAALYASVPGSGHAGSVGLFVGAFCLILSMYGGGFATVPAYLADLFGTRFVGAIHGRLLTAWSVAGIFGPVIVNYLREIQLRQGVAPSRVYDTTMLILAALLVVGFLCNLLIRPVAPKWHLTPAEMTDAGKMTPETALGSTPPATVPAAASPVGLVLIAWLAVGIPLAWGVAQTVAKAAILFR